LEVSLITAAPLKLVNKVLLPERLAWLAAS
jgi:hypothetical protein